MSKYQAVIFDLFGTLVRNVSQETRMTWAVQMTDALHAPQEDFVRLWNQTTAGSNTGEFPTLEANMVAICQALEIAVSD